MNKLNTLFIFFSLFTSIISFDAFAAGEKVSLIAPSVSTSMQGRSIISKMRWVETKPRYADGILVVVRSMLYDPLNYSYNSIDELKNAAESQFNISGENYHIYLYEITDDLGIHQLKHESYKAND
jgi:hypothetical protein